MLDGGAVPTALDVVDGEVRELIRRRGLDPFTEPGPVRVLVRDVVADYSERSLTSALPPIGDPESVVRDVLDRVAGFGPLQHYLDDPEVEEIWVNEPGRVFVARRGRSELTTTATAAERAAAAGALPAGCALTRTGSARCRGGGGHPRPGWCDSGIRPPRGRRGVSGQLSLLQPLAVHLRHRGPTGQYPARRLLDDHQRRISRTPRRRLQGTGRRAGLG